MLSNQWVLVMFIVIVAAGRVLAPAADTAVPVLTVASAPPGGTDTAPAGLIEGIDYAYLGRSHGQPMHWPCTPAITVATLGSVPARARDAIAATTTALTDASGLPLALTDNPQSAAITIGYSSSDIDGDPRILGVTHTSSTGSILTSATITIRADLDDALHQVVVLHEFGHAVGLGHSADTAAEIMTPTSTSTDQLGTGDRYALRTLGCPAPRHPRP